MYDAFAEAFARTRKKPWPDIQEILSIVVSKWYSTLGRVIDIWCGSGRLAWILDNFDEYVGVDITEWLLDIAKKDYPQHRFERCDMNELDTLDLSKFDTIFLVASFHHILDSEKQEMVLRQIKKLLNPGGIIILLNWNLYSMKHSLRYTNNWISEKVLDIPFSWHSRHYYAFSLEELEQKYTQCGFHIEYNQVSQTEDNFLSILSIK